MTVPTACHPGPCAGVAVHGTRGVILSGRRREGSTDGTDCVVTPDLFRGHLTQFPPAYPHGSQPTAQIYWILQPLAGFQDDAASRGQHRVPRSPSCVCSSLTAHSPNLLDPSIPSGFQDDAASRGQHHLTQFPPAYPHGSQPKFSGSFNPLRAFRMTQPRAVSIAFRAVPPASLFPHCSPLSTLVLWILPLHYVMLQEAALKAERPQKRAK